MKVFRLLTTTSTLLRATLLPIALALLLLPLEVGAKCRGHELKIAGCKADKARRGAQATVSDVGTKVGQAAGKAAGDVVKVVQKAGDDAQAAVAKAAEEVVKVAANAVREVSVFGGNVSREAKAGAREAAIALNAVRGFAEKQVESAKDIATNAERRLRQGKIVDAVWQVGIEQWQGTDENTYKAIAQSPLLLTAANAAAATVGPQGSAAYAAWYAYKASGNIQIALRAGLQQGLISAATGRSGEIPKDQIYKRTLAVAAIGGAAAYAAGGDNQAVLEAFLKSGGTVLVEDGYAKVTGRDLAIDDASAYKAVQCLQSLPNSIECAPPEAVRQVQNALPQLDAAQMDQLKKAAAYVKQAKSAAEQYKALLATKPEEIDAKMIDFTLPSPDPAVKNLEKWRVTTLMRRGAPSIESPVVVLSHQGPAIAEATMVALDHDNKELPVMVTASSAMCLMNGSKTDLDVVVRIVPAPLPQYCGLKSKPQGLPSRTVAWSTTGNPRGFCLGKLKELVDGWTKNGATCVYRDDVGRAIAALQ